MRLRRSCAILWDKMIMLNNRERRTAGRHDKRFQVFCRADGRNGIGETLDINDKGLKIATAMDMKIGEIIEMRIVPKDEIFSFTCEGKVVWINDAEHPNGNGKYNIGLQFLQGLKDFAADQLVGGHERLSQRQTMIINASQQACYDAICNFASYPKWQQTIKAVDVLEKTHDGRPMIVDFTMDAILKKIHFINRYEYFDKDFILSWKTAGGDVKTNEGSYVFQKLREDRTNAVFSLYIELGFYAPKRILDYMSNITMRKSVLALKDVVEKGMPK